MNYQTETVHTFCIQNLYKMYTTNEYKMYPKFWQNFVYILYTKAKRAMLAKFYI